MTQSSQQANANPFEALLNLFQKNGNGPSPSSLLSSSSSSIATQGELIVKSFINSINSKQDPSELIQFFNDDVNYVDGEFYNPIIGKEELLRHFYLHQGSSSLSTGSDAKIVMEDMVVSSDEEGIVKVFVLYHMENSDVDGDGDGDSDSDSDSRMISDSQAITYYSVNVNEEKITRIFDVKEPPSPKPGDNGLQLLKTVSKVLDKGNVDADVDADSGSDSDSDASKEDAKASSTSSSTVDQYFKAWNRGDMNEATSLFAQDCVLRDTQYPGAFNGRNEVEAHLANVNECLPSSFQFIIDELVTISSSEAGIREKVGALWHVENGGDDLAFTRGCSFYTTDAKTGLIQSGLEIPEKAPPKSGVLNTISSTFNAEPIRYLPAAMWVAYMVIVFFSDGILPGANALQLEERTWIEVRDLSINFFLVSPLLHLPFSPTVHPMLEGVFNLLLSWAAMFAGFLSDDRKNKPNLLPFGPIVIGMQFLTSAFLLPYLALRSEEKDTGAIVYKEDISGEIQAKVSEWRPLGPFLGTVGTGAIVWALIGRPEFGDFSERYSTFADLMSIDRVGSSFLVDLAIFAMFQGWFIDDDLQRRGVQSDDLVVLRNFAKFVPFFGLATYLSFRPELPSRDEN